jgi:hypothetical protein
VVQAKYEPFDEHRMNGLESLSLFTTQVTLLGFGFFLPAGVQTGHVFRLTLTVLLVAMNLVVIFYFVYLLACLARALLATVSMGPMSHLFGKICDLLPSSHTVWAPYLIVTLCHYVVACWQIVLAGETRTTYVVSTWMARSLMRSCRCTNVAAGAK